MWGYTTKLELILLKILEKEKIAAPSARLNPPSGSAPLTLCLFADAKTSRFPPHAALRAAKQAGKKFPPPQTPSIFCPPAWALLLKNYLVAWHRLRKEKKRKQKW
ncbi:MAG: hypothetical protein QXU40_02720 [Candidatus Pacearchaeota archaeon]